ncbi:phosphatidylinositol transfer protein 3-like [Impatiens glandulifera]|uniref:phosphatidylinositol transfer protein 3-like n=1 Tax=Impatiens glandulifera TaxID=253017 RepID=UPI001FB0EBE6|nr:phosphatidylinositol transfer protein 3-like [Impatiens glandulifera]
MMMMASRKEKTLSCLEQESKINEVKKMIGPIVDKFPVLCSDSSIHRYLRARNWNTKKAIKMLKETIKWRLEYRPDKIKWDDIAGEAEQGRLYIANYLDKFSRTVLVMRPGLQSKLTYPAMQLKHLVYCFERAIMALPTDQEQMVWLIDFQGWNMSKASVKMTKDAARVLQNCYPERLGLALLYNPPKVFESFWMMVKPFLEPKTYRKVKFVFSNHPQGQKTMEDLFDVDKLEPIFGGKSEKGFDYEAYAKQMKEENIKLFDSETTISELQQLASNGGNEKLELFEDDHDDKDENEDEDEDDSEELSNNDNSLSSFEGIIDHKKVDALICCQEKNNEVENKMEEAICLMSEEKRDVPTK